jgi:hypothetical protein
VFRSGLRRPTQTQAPTTHHRRALIETVTETTTETAQRSENLCRRDDDRDGGRGSGGSLGSRRRHHAAKEEIRTPTLQTHTGVGGFQPNLLVHTTSSVNHDLQVCMLRRRLKPLGSRSGNLHHRPFGIVGTQTSTVSRPRRRRWSRAGRDCWDVADFLI